MSCKLTSEAVKSVLGGCLFLSVFQTKMVLTLTDSTSINSSYFFSFSSTSCCLASSVSSMFLNFALQTDSGGEREREREREREKEREREREKERMSKILITQPTHLYIKQPPPTFEPNLVGSYNMTLMERYATL